MTKAVIEGSKIPQCSSTRRAIPFTRKHGSYWAVKRREFITLLGGAAAAWPVAARAQQTAMPTIGFLHSSTPESFADRLRAFHRGLKDTGFVEGENVAIVYRWAENQSDRLPELAAELVRRRVAVTIVRRRCRQRLRPQPFLSCFLSGKIRSRPVLSLASLGRATTLRASILSAVS